jgi:hypothetical protein
VRDKGGAVLRSNFIQDFGCIEKVSLECRKAECEEERRKSNVLRMTYFAPPAPTGLPSCNKLPLLSPCGKINAHPALGLTGKALRTAGREEGRKKVVWPEGKWSLR